MELYHQMLASYFAISHRFDQQIHAPEIVEGICYQTLCAIRDTLADETLSDRACFEQIERIVMEFEKLGISPGGRHDFG